MAIDKPQDCNSSVEINGVTSPASCCSRFAALGFVPMGHLFLSSWTTKICPLIIFKSNNHFFGKKDRFARPYLTRPSSGCDPDKFEVNCSPLHVLVKAWKTQGVTDRYFVFPRKSAGTHRLDTKTTHSLDTREGCFCIGTMWSVHGPTQRYNRCNPEAKVDQGEQNQVADKSNSV